LGGLVARRAGRPWKRSRSGKNLLKLLLQVLRRLDILLDRAEAPFHLALGKALGKGIIADDA